MVILSNYIVPIALLVVGVCIWLPKSRASHEHRADRLAEKLGRVVHAEGSLEVSRRALLVQRSAIVGALLVSGFLVFVIAGVEQAFTAWVVVTGAFLGAAGGAVVAAVIDSGRRPKDAGVRIARGRAVSLGDLLPARRHIWAIAAAAFAIAASAVMSLLFPLAWRWGAGIIVIIALFGLVLIEGAGRWLAGYRQAASSLEELAWNDAFRSRTLRWASGALTAAGFCVAGAVLVTLVSSGGETSSVIAGLASLLSVVPLAGLVWWFSDQPTRDQRFYLTTLWADRSANTAPILRGVE